MSKSKINTRRIVSVRVDEMQRNPNCLLAIRATLEGVANYVDREIEISKLNLEQ